MNQDEIKKILPHRDHMLLVEEVELVDGIAVGKYTVKGDEFFLQGHFPGNSVVPGVILCEMMGQAACVLVKKDGNFTPYFSGMDKVKFKRKVLPHDTITFKNELIAVKGPFYFIKGSGYVDGELCIKGELSFAVIEG